MSWPGWFSLDGNEFINVERTERYAAADGASWFHPTFKSDTLHSVLADPEYRSPLQDDDCPWADPDDSATYGFYGAYPLDVVGLESSTRTSQIVENVGDGGNVGRLRHGTKQIVFNVILVGEDGAAVDAGMRWLRNVLLPGPCTTGECFGATLCYFASEPPYIDGQGPECADEMQRQLLQVTVNTGPTVTAKSTLPSGGEAWQVTFTAVAGLPWEFSLPRPIMKEFLSPTSSNPSVAGGAYNEDGYVVPEVACLPPSYVPIFDPNCPDLTLPPVAPSILLGCYEVPINWRRRFFVIPADYINLWTDAVPVIELSVGSHPVRDLRIRIYSEDVDPEDEPCAFCADMLISYAPEFSSFLIDGREETVRSVKDGQSRRADGLVYGSNRKPFSWPQLSCGQGYTVVVDALQTQIMPVINFDLVPKAR